MVQFFISFPRYRQLIAGLLIGSVVGSLFEVLYRQRRRRSPLDENQAQQLYGPNLERDLASLKAVVTEKVGLLAGTEILVTQLRSELDQQRSRADNAEAELAGLRAPLAGTHRADDLKMIKGIGPVFERRLNAAGITTFAELADTSDESIFAIVKARNRQAVDLDFWRQQAREFAAKK
ncbi:MAG: hypothetical protein ACT4QE_16250 [Anaerolineales bacterium]